VTKVKEYRIFMNGKVKEYMVNYSNPKRFFIRSKLRAGKILPERKFNICLALASNTFLSLLFKSRI